MVVVVCLCVCVCVCVCWRGGGCSINSTARGKRGTMILDGIRQGGGGGGQENTILKGTSEMCCPLSVLLLY